MGSNINQISVTNDDPKLKKRWQDALAKAAVLDGAETQREGVAFILDRFDESISRLALGDLASAYDALTELHRQEASILNGAIETYDAKAQQAWHESTQKVIEAEARERDAVAAKEAAEAERDALAAEIETLSAQVAEKVAENAELAARVAELEGRIADMEEQKSIAAQMMEMLEQLSALQGGGEAVGETSQQGQE